MIQDFAFVVSYLEGKTFIYSRVAASFLLCTISLFSIHWMNMAPIICNGLNKQKNAVDLKWLQWPVGP